MKVVITNTVVLNGGDAAILFGLVSALREAFGEVELTIFDSQPEVARRLYPEFDFRRLLWHQARGKTARVAMLGAAELLASGRESIARPLCAAATFESLRRYAEADLVVWTGGTYMVEHYDLEPRFFEFEIARRLGCPLVLFTQSAGPFDDKRNQRRMKNVVETARLVMVRDERTLGNLLALRPDGDPPVEVADAAFALERPQLSDDGGGRPRVAVSVRHWPHAPNPDDEDRYVAAHASAVRRLVTERDARVTFLSTCQGVPEYWANDSDVASRIVQQIPEHLRRHVFVDANYHRPDELIAAYATFELVIATRMHAAILALVAGTPVLPVAYEFKMRELFRTFGQVDRVRPFGGLDADEFAEWALEGFDQRDELRGPQQAGAERLRASALRAADHLRSAMEQ